MSDENVGSDKGWGPPVDGSLPGDLTYVHEALCPCGWCWCSFRAVGAQGKVCTAGSGTGVGSVRVAVCMKSFLHPLHLSSSLL